MKASEYIENGWCQHGWALDKKGENVGWRNKKAKAWCLHGAIKRSMHEGGKDFKECPELVDIEYKVGLIEWNDAEGMTKRRVLNLLKRNGL